MDLITKFVASVFSENSNIPKKVLLGYLSDFEINRIEKLIGINVAGFCRIIDCYSIRHTIKKHGSKHTEEPRGQIVVELNDFSKIPEIIELGLCRDGGLSKIGSQTIVYELLLEKGIYVYVEEIRKGKHEIVLQTLYIKKPPRM